MTAIQPNVSQGYVDVWRMPVASDRVQIGHSETFLNASSQALQAMKTFENGVVWAGVSRQKSSHSTLQPDLLVGAENLWKYAASKGVDLNALLCAASTHFEPGPVVEREGPFSAAELEFFTDDHQSAIDRELPSLG